MPEDMQFRARRELLSFEEISRVVSVFSGLGVRRVRLTGGEPTVRADVVNVVGQIGAIDGIDAVVMTSNGVRLIELADPLARAGLKEVNISLDTLDAKKFHELTRRNKLAQVIAGIDSALAAGLEVKINIVALQGVNDDEVVSLCEFAWSRGVIPRFIEHMPMSSGSLFEPRKQLTAHQIRAAVTGHCGGQLQPYQPGPATGPARYWTVDGDDNRRFGIISAMSEHFCDTCNRVRLTAAGDLHACLAYDDAVSLRDIIRAGGSDTQVEDAIRAALHLKRVGHEFQNTGLGAPTKHMISIGG